MTPTTRAVARKATLSIVQSQNHEHDSDYGSDLDEDALECIFSEVDVLQPFSEPIVLESIEEYNPLPRVAHIPYPQLPAQQDVSGATSIAQDGSPANLLARSGQLRGPSVEVEYDESNRASFSPSRFGNST